MIRFIQLKIHIFFTLTALLLFFTAHTQAEDISSINWQAKWICATNSPTSAKPNTWYIFRKEFDLNEKENNFHARIAIDSKYWLWINGIPVVRDGGLKRCFSPNGTYYDLLDLSPYLKQGTNIISVLLCYYGITGFSHLSSGYPALLFEGDLNGAPILSDASWTGQQYKAFTTSTHPQPNGRLSEGNVCFDARQKVPDWKNEKFSQTMPQVKVIAEAEDKRFGELYPRPIPQWKDYGIKPYVSIKKVGNKYTCQLPYNCQITPYFKIKAKAGQKIDIRSDNYDNTGGISVRAEYITCDSIQEFESPGWMNGHKITYTIPDNIEVDTLMYRETGYDTNMSGYFSCNDEFLTELWKRSARTLYVCMRDSWMDCPDRERAQWWGDEVLELLESFYALSPSAYQLTTKGMRELLNWQQKDGNFYAPTPYGDTIRTFPLQMLAAIGWYGFYTQYYYSGDSLFVKDAYQPIKRYLHSTWKLDQDNLCKERPGSNTWHRDWGDWGTNVDVDLLTNCWYYLALKTEKAFALQLGEDEEALNIELQMEQMAINFNERFWTGKEYRSTDYKGSTDERSQAMAILAGLASEEKIPKLINILTTIQNASPYMEKYVLEALFKTGQSKLAINRMKARYKTMLNNDLTTLFELWNLNTPNISTSNHGWSGGPLALMGQYLCGIQPTSPGFQTFHIKPQWECFEQLETRLETIYGFISMNLQQYEEAWSIELHVPDGTIAEITMPNNEYQALGAGNHSLYYKPDNINRSNTNSQKVIIRDGYITLPGYEGPLRVYTLSGVELPSLAKPAPGIYLLKAGNKTIKFHIR